MNTWEVQNWFEKHVTIGGEVFSVSDEQAKVILDEHKNTIVTARAGSGKTRTIVAKIIYLIAHEGYDADEILAFAFNRNACDELNSRLASVRVDGLPVLQDNLDKYSRIATTFHSFAARARSFGGEILSDNDCDDKDKQAFVSNRSYFVQRIIKEKLNRKKILEFVRDSGRQKADATTCDDSECELIDRDEHFETLNGEIVKSFGEKIIADYLFEHDISYRYEGYNLYPGQLVEFAKDDAAADRLKYRNVVRPDFYLEDYNLIWEHWGISGLETPEEIKVINKAKVFDGGYEAYKAGKEWKEWFYRREWLKDSIKSDGVLNNFYLAQVVKFKDLICSYKEPYMMREEFEKEIDEILSGYGISKPKLSEEEIIKKLMNNKNREVVTQLTEQIMSFIDKAEHGFMSDYGRLGELCKEENDPHVKLFYELAMETLLYYHNELVSDASDEKQRPLLNDCFEKKYTTDFNILLDGARRAIDDGKENPRLKVDGYKYIFIDEYQDFSTLFYNLVVALRNRSKEAKMVVVGDDWQAINGYAGSDLKYFENFEEYFSEDTCRLELLTNRRSNSEIVKLSNEFMMRAGVNGVGSQYSRIVDLGGDALQLCQVTELHKKKDANSKRPYICQQYDFALTQIIRENRDKTICVLSRKNKMKAYNSSEHCRNTIAKEFKLDDYVYANNTADELMEKVSVSTVNKAKGCEADVVVILETDDGSFPVIHPDTKLYKVFGESEEKMIDEQKRLFYVALTRPKERLYILHEKNFEDDVAEEDNFLTMLNKNALNDYSPKPKQLENRIIDGEIKSFILKAVDFVKNKRRPENQDIIVTAANGEQVRQFNTNPHKDRESCELMRYCSDFIEANPKKGLRVWVDVQEGRWIHFRKRRASDLMAKNIL